jgi:hypothetical protein
MRMSPTRLQPKQAPDTITFRTLNGMISLSVLGGSVGNTKALKRSEATKESTDVSRSRMILPHRRTGRPHSAKRSKMNFWVGSEHFS